MYRIYLCIMRKTLQIDGNQNWMGMGLLNTTFNNFFAGSIPLYSSYPLNTKACIDWHHDAELFHVRVWSFNAQISDVTTIFYLAEYSMKDLTNFNLNNFFCPLMNAMGFFAMHAYVGYGYHV